MTFHPVPHSPYNQVLLCLYRLRQLYDDAGIIIVLTDPTPQPTFTFLPLPLNLFTPFTTVNAEEQAVYAPAGDESAFRLTPTSLSWFDESTLHLACRTKGAYCLHCRATAALRLRLSSYVTKSSTGRSIRTVCRVVSSGVHTVASYVGSDTGRAIGPLKDQASICAFAIAISTDITDSFRRLSNHLIPTLDDCVTMTKITCRARCFQRAADYSIEHCKASVSHLHVHTRRSQGYRSAFALFVAHGPSNQLLQHVDGLPDTMPKVPINQIVPPIVIPDEPNAVDKPKSTPLIR